MKKILCFLILSFTILAGTIFKEGELEKIIKDSADKTYKEKIDAYASRLKEIKDMNSNDIYFGDLIKVDEVIYELVLSEDLRLVLRNTTRKYEYKKFDSMVELRYFLSDKKIAIYRMIGDK